MEFNLISSSRQMLRAFGGLNETYGCGEAELSQGRNFSSRGYPALATRKHRRHVRHAAATNGMYHLNGLLVVSRRDLIYNPDETPQKASFVWNAVTDSEKQMIGMGTKVLIWPDKVAFDTKDLSVTKLGAEWKLNSPNAVTGSKSVSLTPCDAAGKTYTVTQRGATEPEDPDDGTLFLKLNDQKEPYSSENVLEIYSAATGNWSAIELNCCKLEATGIGKDFAVGDTVTISGMSGAEEHLKGLDGDHAVSARDDDWIQIELESSGTMFYGVLTKLADKIQWIGIDGMGVAGKDDKQEFVLERRVPDIDFLTECDNRVWGCSSKENVIYACKLGDPSNWFSYRGTAADSYAVNVGSDGSFTGAATCMGYVLFFKENCIHKLYGSKPSDYQMSSVKCAGVAKGAAKSLCVLNEVLYYFSPSGVMAWDGSLPTKVSGNLETERLNTALRAVGGALGGRYYLYLAAKESQRLLVLDTERGLWTEEDPAGQEMCSTGRQLYLYDGESLWGVDPDKDEGELDRVQYEMVTGDIGLALADDKYISRVTIRLDAMERGVVTVWASYDGGAWKEAGRADVSDKWTRVNLPFVPERCDTLRLKLTGTGQLVVRSIALTLASAMGNRVGK